MAAPTMHPKMQPFADILKPDAPVGPLTAFHLGGKCEWLADPQSAEQLAALVRACLETKTPIRVLGLGGNLLVREEGVRGVVIRLAAPAFTTITVEGRKVRAGCGASTSKLIATASQHNLAGLETLAGLPGTVGGAIRLNAGDKASEIGQYVRKVEVIDASGAVQIREPDDLRFGLEHSNLDDPVLLAAELELDTDRPASIEKRIRKAWIQHQAVQPYSFEHAGRMFRNPPGLNAAALVDQAGLAGTSVGGARVSERNANYVVVQETASPRDVLRLIELVRAKVKERFNVELEQALSVW